MLWNIIRDSLDGIKGITVTILTGGFSIYSFIEKATPILAFIGLIVSIGCGIATIINLTRKNKILKDVGKEK